MHAKKTFLIITVFFLLLILAGLYSFANREQKQTRPKNTTSPPNFISGESRFSQGKCEEDSDCVVTGCSGEICSGKGEVISTCEFSESFPNTENYRCGCYNNICGWKQK